MTTTAGFRPKAPTRRTHAATAPGDPVLRNEQEHLTRAHRRRRARGDSAVDASVTSAAALPRTQTLLTRELWRSASRFTGDKPLVVGRLEDDQGAVYVGYAYLDGNADGSGDPDIISWEAPAARRLYTASPRDPEGLHLRRKLVCAGERVTGYVDDISVHGQAITESKGSGGRGRQVDPLLTDLERGRTGELLDIVATLQPDQYALLEAPGRGVLVVQGGPGSGKTVVGLHRLAYLLANDQTLSPEQTLVVGPNPVYLQYVAGLLPSLGRDEVVQRDLAHLVDDVTADGEDEPDVTALKGDPRMTELLARAVRALPVVKRDLTVQADSATIRLTAGRVNHLLTELMKRRLPRDRARTMLMYQVVDAAYEVYRRSYARPVGQQADLVYLALRAHPALKGLVDDLLPAGQPDQFLDRLLRDRVRLRAAAQGAFTGDELERLYRPWRQSFTVADAPLLVELDVLLNGPSQRYRHVMVDEAQNLTPMQARMLGHLARGGGVTLLGDLAQATVSQAYDDWDELVRHLLPALSAGSELPVRVENLPVSYRVPAEVLELANRLLPDAAPHVPASRPFRHSGFAPSVARSAEPGLGSAAMRAARDAARPGRSVAVISPVEQCDTVLDAAASLDVEVGDGRTGDLSAGITVLPAETCGGLEFDAVVIVEPAAIAGGTQVGLRQLYVALTRTTGALHLVHSRPLPEQLCEPNQDDSSDDAVAGPSTDPAQAALEPTPQPELGSEPEPDEAADLRSGIARALTDLDREDLAVLLSLAHRLQRSRPARPVPQRRDLAPAAGDDR